MKKVNNKPLYNLAEVGSFDKLYGVLPKSMGLRQIVYKISCWSMAVVFIQLSPSIGKIKMTL